MRSVCAMGRVWRRVGVGYTRKVPLLSLMYLFAAGPPSPPDSDHEVILL